MDPLFIRGLFYPNLSFLRQIVFHVMSMTTFPYMDRNRRLSCLFDDYSALSSEEYFFPMVRFPLLPTRTSFLTPFFLFSLSNKTGVFGSLFPSLPGLNLSVCFFLFSALFSPALKIPDQVVLFSPSALQSFLFGTIGDPGILPLLVQMDEIYFTHTSRNHSSLFFLTSGMPFVEFNPLPP